jgi:hypothetical protein
MDKNIGVINGTGRCRCCGTSVAVHGDWFLNPVHVDEMVEENHSFSVGTAPQSSLEEISWHKLFYQATNGCFLFFFHQTIPVIL